jgi:1-acyl-sn-glycerol-3-phosphate acyltransferase
MMRLVRHVLRVLFTGSSFLLFFTGGAILSTIILPLVRLAKGTPDEKAARCRQWVSDSWVFFHGYMRFFGLIDYDPRRVTARLPEGPVVVVANHPTLVDVTAIMSAWGRLVCVAKTDVFKSPLVGRLLRYCGHIDGGDGGLFSAASVVTQSVEALRHGAAILIFPEGTRSPENGMHAFRQGAFEMAARANVPLVPVFITCNPPTLMRGQGWWEVPVRTARLDLTPLPALAPPLGDPAVACAKLQREFEERLKAFWAQDATPVVPAAAPAVQARAAAGEGGP